MRFPDIQLKIFNEERKERKKETKKNKTTAMTEILLYWRFQASSVKTLEGLFH